MMGRAIGLVRPSEAKADTEIKSRLYSEAHDNKFCSNHKRCDYLPSNVINRNRQNQLCWATPIVMTPLM